MVNVCGQIPHCKSDRALRRTMEAVLAGRVARMSEMTELELKLSLPDQIAEQAEAAELLTSEAIERLVRQAIRKTAAERLIEYGKRLHEPGEPEITEPNSNPN
jgi:post-segregation antitoxin (ccd killing protein)